MGGDFGNLLLGEFGVEEVEVVLAASETDDPDVVGVFFAGGFVDEEAFADEDEAQDETEVEFGLVGGLGEAFKKGAEDFIVNEDLLFLVRVGHDGWPEGEEGFAVEGQGALGAEVEAFEDEGKVTDGGEVFLAWLDGSGADTTAAQWSGELVWVAWGMGFEGSCRAQGDLRVGKESILRS